MTYFKSIKEKFQKDLYIKKTFSVTDSVTPWIPKNDIKITSIHCKLNETPAGDGSTNIVFYKNKDQGTEAIIKEFTFIASENNKSTATNFSFNIDSLDQITHSITSVCSGSSGGQAIISFIYENR